MGADTSHASGASASQEVLVWRVHLAAQHGRRTLWVVLMVALAGALGYAVFEHPLGAILPVGLLFAALFEFWWPITYRLTCEGVVRTHGLGSSFLAWKDVKHCQAETDVVWLSVQNVPSRRGPFRGMALRLPKGAADRDRILAALRKRCGTAVERGAREGGSCCRQN